MRAPLLAGTALLAALACAPFKDDGVYKCNLDKGECVASSKGWDIYYVPQAMGVRNLRDVKQMPAWTPINLAMVGANGAYVYYDGSNWSRGPDVQADWNSVTPICTMVIAGDGYIAYWIDNALAWRVEETCPPGGPCGPTTPIVSVFCDFDARYLRDGVGTWVGDSQGKLWHFVPNDETETRWTQVSLQDAQQSGPLRLWSTGSEIWGGSSVRHMNYFQITNGSPPSLQGEQVCYDDSAPAYPLADVPIERIWGPLGTGASTFLLVNDPQAGPVLLEAHQGAPDSPCPNQPQISFKRALGGGNKLRGLCGVVSDDSHNGNMFFVGDHGRMAMVVGDQLMEQWELPTTDNLTAVSCDSGHIFVVSETGLLLHRTWPE